MNEVRKSEIIYEEGWRESPKTEIEADTAPLDEQKPEKDAQAESSSKPLLISVQLVVTLLLALALFLLKAMGSSAFTDFTDFYKAELEKPLISQGVFSSLDLSRLFGELDIYSTATSDEA